jgi:hypothetical protein
MQPVCWSQYPCLQPYHGCINFLCALQNHIQRMREPIAPFQMQPLVNDHTWTQLIHIATKIAILQPNIGVTTGLDPSSASSRPPSAALDTRNLNPQLGLQLSRHDGGGHHRLIGTSFQNDASKEERDATVAWLEGQGFTPRKSTPHKGGGLIDGRFQGRIRRSKASLPSVH